MLSVIIPNYNHAPYLRQRIESVLSQTFGDMELIILDDCSTDNSREIIEEYRNHPAVSQIVYNGSNSGSPFKQWNKGISLARGKYIWIAESDDYAKPEFAETCISKLTDYPEIDLVYTDSNEVNERSENLGLWSRWMEYLAVNLWQKDFTASGETLNAAYNHLICIITNASSAIFKKEAYLNSPFIKSMEDLRFTGDWWMWFSILQVSSVYYCHKPLNYFRYHANTTRANVNARLAIARELYGAILKFKTLVKPKADQHIKKRRFKEIYAIWNPPVKTFLARPNLQVLRMGLACDKQLPLRIFSTLIKRLRAV